MPDISKGVVAFDNSVIRVKFKDMGDGTYAEIVTLLAPNVEPTSRSDSIDLGGTAQQLAPANGARHFFRFQNQSNEDLWIRDDGSAATMNEASIKIPAGALYEPTMISRLAISIIGATTGQAFSAQEG